LDDGIRPYNKDVSIILDAGALYYDFEKLLSLRPTYSGIGGNGIKILKPLILHKPTKCNFWHYEIFWLDEDGNDISEQTGNWIRRAVSGIRTSLKLIALEPHSEHYYRPLEADYIN